MVELGLDSSNEALLPDNDTVYFDEGQCISVLKPSCNFHICSKIDVGR